MRLSLCILILLAARHLRRSSHKIKDSHKLLMTDIGSPADSPWARIKINRSNRGYIIMTSLTVTAFDRLYVLLYPTPLLPPRRYNGGRPPTLSEYDQLAMTLFFLHSACNLNQIALLFGCSVSTCSRQIREHVIKLAEQLPRYPDATIEWPDDEKVDEYGDMMKAYMDATHNQATLFRVARSPLWTAVTFASTVPRTPS